MASERLLMVEDEDIVRESIMRVLGRAGFQVEGVASADAALERLRQQEYELLLIDIKMPRMSGIEFLREVRRQGNNVGALIITGYGTMEHAAEAMELGAQGFLLKPIYPQQLLQMVRDTLTRRRLTLEVQRVRTFAPLLDVSRLAQGEGELARLAEAFLGILLAHTQATSGAVLVRDEEGRLVPLAAVPQGQGVGAVPPSRARQVEAWLHRGREEQAMARAALSWPELHPLPEPSAAAAAIPLPCRGSLTGLLVLQGEGENVLRPVDMEFLSTAARFLAVALENGRAYTQAQDRIRELERRLRGSGAS